MYKIDKYYDHYVIKENDKILCHIDNILEAEKELNEINNKFKISSNVNNKTNNNESSERYNNYHKHSHYSNLRTLDCISKPEYYMKRAVELGHTTYFTTEHAYQSNIFEAYISNCS